MNIKIEDSLINTTERKAQPFVKWVGGKRGLLTQILPQLPKDFENYFEPFIGGGALFFELYNQKKLDDKNVYLFDINKELTNTYLTIKTSPELLINELEKMKKEHCKEFYYKVRAWDREEDFTSMDSILKAARFIYLNKTCFNGLYRVNKKNQNNVPMGSYKNPSICDVETLYNASEALQIANIENNHYSKVLDYASKNDLIYFDPPYYPLNATSSFTSYSEFEFLDKQQIELFEVYKKLSQKECYVVHSNSNTTFIEDLYKEFNINEISANRFINSKSDGRGKIKELLILNYGKVEN